MKTPYLFAAGWLITSVSGLAQVPEIVTSGQGVPLQQEAAIERRPCADSQAIVTDEQQQERAVLPECLAASAGAQSNAAPMASANDAQAAGAGLQEPLQIATVAPGGFGVLNAPGMTNENSIEVQLGGDASRFVPMDMTGDRLITVLVNPAALQCGAAQALQPGGCSGMLSARAADALLDTVLNTDGTARATSLASQQGSLFLGAAPAASGSTGTSSTPAPAGETVAALGQGLPVIATVPSSGDMLVAPIPNPFAGAAPATPIDYTAPFSVLPIGLPAGAPSTVIAAPLIVPVATPPGSTATPAVPGGSTTAASTSGSVPGSAPAPGTSTSTTPSAPVASVPTATGPAPTPSPVTGPTASAPPAPSTGGTTPTGSTPPAGNPSAGPPIFVPAPSAPRGENGAGRPFVVVTTPGNSQATPGANGNGNAAGGPPAGAGAQGRGN